MGSASGGTAQVEMDTGEPATETVAGSPSFSEDVKRRQTCLRSGGGVRGGGSPPRVGSNAPEAPLCGASGEQSEDFCAARRRESNGIMRPATETVAGSPSFSEDVKGRQTCLRSSGGYPAGLHLWTVYAILAFTLAVPPKQGAAIRVSV